MNIRRQSRIGCMNEYLGIIRMTDWTVTINNAHHFSHTAEARMCDQHFGEWSYRLMDAWYIPLLQAYRVYGVKIFIVSSSAVLMHFLEDFIVWMNVFSTSSMDDGRHSLLILTWIIDTGKRSKSVVGITKEVVKNKILQWCVTMIHTTASLRQGIWQSWSKADSFYILVTTLVMITDNTTKMW